MTDASFGACIYMPLFDFAKHHSPVPRTAVFGIVGLVRSRIAKAHGLESVIFDIADIDQIAFDRARTAA